ncbi:recombinase family protein [Streptosporangium lutulentum]|uniref:DNA invertase Pin-like site-specific DNA recombinase/transcriptional regulator NrdR family protein n=1 Tax=Streptosporangium lutulentum TaxID=1461250 RepID=A0ABT9Q9C9_9ACTN|nr:recombinase family protein [Streptosporangium lutulentum]MDP9843357.1 DNA invertase Pin-like site-specific DNA recombinase/transcriptional regulator NrdR family protein [Streptosporangium lutulentum]
MHVPPGQQPLIPAIGYIRVSMMLEEKISPDIQRASIKELARRRGFRIIEWVEDLDVSGRTFQRKIMTVIADVEAARAKAILVWKYSRFGRNRTGNQLNLARVEKAGGELVSATEEIDARTAVGKLTRGVLFELAAFESDRAGEQWGEAFQNRLARGLPPLGAAQFGYIRRGRARHPLYHDRTLAAPEDGPERYEPDHASGIAGILADCYDRWIADRSFSVLADWVNARGARTTSGGKFRPSELARVMDRGFAAGLICVHHRDCRCAKPSSCRNKEYHPGAHKEVISMETWETYKRYRKITSALPPRARRAVYPMSKMCKCGYCTNTMYPLKVNHSGRMGWVCGSIYRKRYDVPRCGTRFVTMDAVEEAVQQVLVEWVPEIEAAAALAAAGLQVVTEAEESRPEALRRELERIDKALERQTELLINDVIPQSSYEPVRDKLLREREEVLDALAEFDDLRDPIDPMDCVPVIEGLIQEWDSLPADRLRNILAEVIDHVDVYREDPTTAWIVVHSVWGESRRHNLSARFSKWKHRATVE